MDHQEEEETSLVVLLETEEASEAPGTGLDQIWRPGLDLAEGEAEVGDTKVDETPYGRRNPWGPFSYAQLITQAICSEPDQRMTLNQIYEFLISNFPYFAERRSHQQSAGWKVKLSSLPWHVVAANFIIKLSN